MGESSTPLQWCPVIMVIARTSFARISCLVAPFEYGVDERFSPDFGVDALRVYCLYMGPPERDYVFQWQGLASAYRLVNRVWTSVRTVTTKLMSS